MLERGQFTPTDGDDDYFICTIAPLMQEQDSFNYGTLVNYDDIVSAQIPMDLYFKAALDIIEQNDKQTATDGDGKTDEAVLQHGADKRRVY